MAHIVTSRQEIAQVKSLISQDIVLQEDYLAPSYVRNIADIFDGRYKLFCVCDYNYVTSPEEGGIYDAIFNFTESASLYISHLAVNVDSYIQWSSARGYPSICVNRGDDAGCIRKLLSEDNDKLSAMDVYVESAAIISSLNDIVGWFSTYQEVAIFSFEHMSSALRFVDSSSNIKFMGMNSLSEFTRLDGTSLAREFGASEENIVGNLA